MSKIIEYTSVNTFDSGDVLLKDGSNGTKIIPVESAASEFLRLGGQNDKNDQIETSLTNFGSNLAGLEAEYVATNDYAVGDFFMVENKLYKATADIADGDTIVPDTNCVETDISTEFKATKEIVDGLSEEIVKKANVDGYYTNLSAGTADQLMASQKVHNSDPYIFRTSGGTSDIGNREELEIVGGSIVWNQLVHHNRSTAELDGVTFTNNGDGTWTLNGEATANTLKEISDYKLVAGHKYLFTGIPSGGSATTFRVFIAYVGVIYSDTVFTYSESVNSTVQIGTISGYTASNLVFKPQLFDLTAMFGSTIADHIYELEQAEAGTGVAWFRKYFPNDYYDYNPGELMHVTDLQSHDTVGFNLFDKTAVKNNKWINTSTGAIEGATGYTLSDYIRVQKGKTIRIPNTGSNRKGFYSLDKKFVNRIDTSLFTPPEDGYVLVTVASDVDVNSVCINLSWSDTRDGEYEPYVKHSYPLDSSLTLRGIPKLTADGDLTYDGDIYKPDGTVERRYGIVDLGTLNWSYNIANQGAFTSYTIKDQVASNNIVHSTAYEHIYNFSSSQLANTGKGIGINKSTPGTAQTGNFLPGAIVITDSAYSDAETFKAAMSGIYLVYELAEPTTEEAQPYTSPQIVDDWGTEEFVTTSIVPVGHNTSYPANLRDKLQHLPDLPDSDGYYMTQVDGTQMSLIRFRIPQAPAEDGTYVLKATVTDGVPVYTWIDPDAVPEPEEPAEP